MSSQIQAKPSAARTKSNPGKTNVVVSKPCTSCKKQIKSDAAFCAHCGKPQAKSKFCPQCGKPIPAGSATCKECSLAGASQISVCSNCHTPLSGEMRFCSSCGTMVPSKPGAKYAHGKNLPAAILLSCLLLPGLGHLYCGDIVKGILFVIAAILAVIYTGPGVFVVSIFALIDVCGVATGKKPLWLM